MSFAYVKGDFGNLGGGTAVRRNYQREYEQFKLFKKKWGSKVVKGAPTAGHQTGGERKAFVNKYDFSHPTVKIPIEGV